MYKKLKVSKVKFTNFLEKFDNGENLKTEEIEQCNLYIKLVLNLIIGLTKLDTSLRKLIPRYLNGFFDFLLEIFNNNETKIRNYVLIIIFNLLKEVDICEIYGSVIYETIFNKMINSIITLYQVPIKDSKDKKLEQKLSSELVSY